jgi:GTP cyclohydrolase III
VAGAVSALGVGAQQTVDLVVGLIETGQPMDEITRLPSHVQAGVSQGLSPNEAAAGAGSGRGRHGGARGQDRPSKKQKDKPGRP